MFFFSPFLLVVDKVAVSNSAIHMLMALICGRAGLWPLAVSCNQLRGEKVRDAEITFLDSCCYSAVPLQLLHDSAQYARCQPGQAAQAVHGALKRILHRRL